MHVDDPLRDGKAESGAPEGVTPRFIDAVKTLENLFLIFKSNSNSSIFDTHNGAPVLLFRCKCYFAG